MTKRLASIVATGFVVPLAFTAMLLPVSPARADDRDVREGSSRSDNWNATTMEATSVLGEFLFERNDHAAAKNMFQDSLGTSTKLRAPREEIVAMDLYRTAQLDVHDGDISLARHHLEILIGRYGYTAWADRGRELLKRLPESYRGEGDEEEFVATSPDPMQPEMVLKRLQNALHEDNVADALSICQQFLQSYAPHAAADEVRLAQGALLLRSHEAGQAAQALEAVLRQSGDAAVLSKARYLLGLAYLSTGDHEALSAAVPVSGPAPDRWFTMALVWRAASEEHQGHWSAAGPLLRRALNARYHSPVKAYALAALAADLGRNNKPDAAATMRDALQEAKFWSVDSVAEYARLNLGHLLYGQRRYAEAAAAYEQFQKEFSASPEAPVAAFQRAMSFKRAGLKNKAAQAFNDLVRLYPDSKRVPDGYLQLGQIYSDQGNVQKAVTAYKEMARSGSGADKDSQLLIAQVHYNRKRYKEAIAIYQNFLEESPNDPRAYQVQDLLLSSYWLGLRNDPGLDRAVELYPNHPVVAHIRWELGARAYKAKNFVLAQEQFRRVIKDFPKSGYVPGSLFFQGECLMQLKDFLAAAKAYRGIADFPKSPYAKQGSFKLGLALFQAGDYPGAAAAYGAYRGDGRDPSTADAAFNRALAFDKADRKPQALSAYEALVKRFPKYPRASWAWLQIGIIRESLGRHGEAAAAYAYVRSEQRSLALFSRGRCLEKIKQRVQARKVYEELRQLKPASDPHRIHGVLRLALLYELESPRKAAPLYREVLRLAQDTESRDVARGRLEAAEQVAADFARAREETGAQKSRGREFSELDGGDELQVPQ